MKPHRRQWSNDEKTYILDQFRVKLWEPSSGPEVNETKIDFECEMVVCEVNAFLRTDEDYTEESFCWLNDQCKYTDSDRYSILQHNFQRRNGEFYRSQLLHSEENIIFTKNRESCSSVARFYVFLLLLLIS